MIDLTEDEARKILDFLAKRCGYDSWKIVDSTMMSTAKCLVFCLLGGEDVFVKNKTLFTAFRFHPKSDLQQIVKAMVVNNDSLLVFDCRTKNMAYVFEKDEDCLESLMIKIDLDAQYA